MPKKNYRVSKTTNTLKLFSIDKTYIKNKVQELRGIEKDFASEATAIRHYIHVGIAAEISTTDIRKSLENSIVKRSQKEAVRKELEIVTADLMEIERKIIHAHDKSQENFSDMARRLEILETKVGAESEAIQKNVADSQQHFEEALTAQTLKLQIDNKYLLRNVLILRTLSFLMLLFAKEAENKKELRHLKNWSGIVNLVRETINNVPLDLMKQVSEPYFETELVEAIGRELYKDLKKN